MDTRMSEHFMLSEFTQSTTASNMQIANVPDGSAIENLARLCDVLEKVRSLLQHPISITSGYRSQILNEAVGGVNSSMHIQGCAADFICPAFGTPEVICKMLRQHMADFGIDQLIWEYNSWVHLGISLSNASPRNMALTIDSSGTKTGFA